MTPNPGRAALVREAELDAMADWLATSRELPLSVGGLARWAETHGDRLIATAYAYHALLDAYAALVERERALETAERLLFAWWAAEGNVTTVLFNPEADDAAPELAAWQVALQALRDWCATRMHAALTAASHEETSHD